MFQFIKFTVWDNWPYYSLHLLRISNNTQLTSMDIEYEDYRLNLIENIWWNDEKYSKLNKYFIDCQMKFNWIGFKSILIYAKCSNCIATNDSLNQWLAQLNSISFVIVVKIIIKRRFCELCGIAFVVTPISQKNKN